MKQTLLLIGFMIITLAGAAGVVSWQKPATAVGYYNIGTNPYGVAIYQDGPHANVQFVHATMFTVNGAAITISAPTSIMYSRDDIIFDATGTLYTEPTQEEIAYVSQSIGKQLTKVGSSDRTIPLPVQSFYLINPHIPGELEFRIPNERGLWINRDQKQIGGWTGTTVTVLVHDTVSI
jgi:hypothetical protein